jgi:hypothetical protein
MFTCICSGTYSARSGWGLESCLPCPGGTYSSEGMMICQAPLSCFPLNQQSTSLYSADLFSSGSTSGVTFELAPDMPVPGDSVATFTGSSSQHITFRNDCSGLPVSQLSVTFWVKVKVLSQSFFLGCFGQAMGWYVGTSGTGRSFAFVLASAESPVPTLIADEEKLIAASTWYHLAATYNGREMSLYTDGQLTRSSAAQAGLIVYPPNNAAFRLGRYEDSTTKMYFHGQLSLFCLHVQNATDSVMHLRKLLWLRKFANTLWFVAGSLDDMTLWDTALSADVIDLLHKEQSLSSFFCCPKSCPSGQVSNNLCSGTPAQDCSLAYKCPACVVGQRLSVPCSGAGSSVPASCAQCRPSCAPGVAPNMTSRPIHTSE